VRRPTVRRMGSSIASLMALAIASGAVQAADYHVAQGTCTHGSGAGSDSNSGSSRSAAFLTVQKCLSVLTPGSTCWIHSGDYVGDFETPAPLVATKLTPTRILGAAGDTAILTGTTSQTAYSSSTYYQDNIATLSIKATTSVASQYFEIGNLTLRTGNSSALVMTRAQHVYLHDLKFDNQSRYAMGSAESNGIINAYSLTDFFADRITVSNGGTIATFNVFSLQYAFDGKVRMLDVSDIKGGVEQAHFNRNVTFEFVRMRNFRAWTDDDGAVRDSYNSSYAVDRYWSAKEASSGSPSPVWGWRNARRTDATLGQRSSLYQASVYFEKASVTAGNYGAWAHSGTGTGGSQVPDFRVYNSVAERFPMGILATTESASGDDCLRHENKFNAYIGITILPVDGTRSSCGSAWSKHATEIVPASSGATDQIPTTGSALIDKGSSDTFAGTPYFPPPIGGGSRIDIGAYEFGAGPWPYEFQTIATTNKLTPRICWGTGISGCDVIIPLWDPTSLFTSSRTSATDVFWVEIDGSNAFRTGNSTTAAGFGAMHASGAVASANKFYDVPAAALQNQRDYYVQVRVGESTSPDNEGRGPGPWSLGFYRFRVDTGAPNATPPPNVNNLRRTDDH